MFDMPTAQLLALLLKKDAVFKKFQDDLKKEMTVVAIKELSDAYT